LNFYFLTFVDRKPGHFGDFNRPGLPQKLLVVGKYASAANARAPLSSMEQPTLGQAVDVKTLNMLADDIVNAYLPGDTVLVAMNQPVSICIGFQDLVSLRDCFHF
jgi:hypothetical protein